MQIARPAVPSIVERAFAEHRTFYHAPGPSGERRRKAATDFPIAALVLPVRRTLGLLVDREPDAAEALARVLRIAPKRMARLIGVGDEACADPTLFEPCARLLASTGMTPPHSPDEWSACAVVTSFIKAVETWSGAGPEALPLGKMRWTALAEALGGTRRAAFQRGADLVDAGALLADQSLLPTLAADMQTDDAAVADLIATARRSALRLLVKGRGLAAASLAACDALGDAAILSLATQGLPQNWESRSANRTAAAQAVGAFTGTLVTSLAALPRPHLARLCVADGAAVVRFEDESASTPLFAEVVGHAVRLRGEIASPCDEAALSAAARDLARDGTPLNGPERLRVLSGGGWTDHEAVTTAWRPHLSCRLAKDVRTTCRL